MTGPSISQHARSFELVCPSGWVRIDPTSFDQHRIAALAAQFARRADKAVRAVVADRIAEDLGRQLRGLGEAGALLVLMAGPTSPLSVWEPLVAVTPLTWEEGVEPMPALMATAAHDPTAQVYDLDEAVALRTWSSSALDIADVDSALADSGIDPHGAQVDRARLGGMRLARYTLRYQIGIPDDRDCWVEAVCVATMAAPSDSTLDHEALIELFDAVLSTFRWVTP